MSSIKTLIDGVAAAAEADAQGTNPSAHATLLHRLQTLTLAVEKPSETAKRILYQPPINIALRIAVELGIFETLCRAGSGNITVHEIAISSSIEEALVVRIMRVMAAAGLCKEVGFECYSPNDVTRQFASDALSDGVKCLYDTVIPAAASVVEYLTYTGRRIPKKPDETPFSYAQKATLFEWLDKTEAQRKYFDNFMAARRKESFKWFEIFPITESFMAALKSGREDVLIVDVGGSHGHDLIQFRERYLHLPGQVVLQDLPETISSIRNLPHEILAMAHNFFTPQPVVGSRIYYFGTVCHDWADEYCIDFLSKTASAMEKGYSSLLIYDTVMPEIGASLRAAAMDIQMMTLFAGIERTERQWAAVLEASGLEFVRIWYSATKYESVIEAKVR